MRDDTNNLFPKGKLTFFRLVSNNICYGPMPEPGDIVEQHLSIRVDGHVWLSFYQYATVRKFIKSESKQINIEQSQAEYILGLVQDYFSSRETERFVTDVGVWDMELRSSMGEKWNRRGSLVSDNGDLERISDVIRQSLDLPNLFCFDGAYKSDRIESIKVDYRRVTKIHPGVIPDGAEWEFVTWNYNEHLYIDRETETIEHFQKIGEECDITRTYHIGEGVSDFLDDYDIDSFLTEIEGNPDDVIDDPMNVTTYNVEIRYKYAEPRYISGSYDKKALPADWPDFMDGVWEFMRFYGMGEIMDSNIYGKARRRSSDYMFVFVTFEEYGQEYSYLCDDDNVSEGDLVLVPVGNDSKTTVVPVSKIEYHPADEAPYPIEKIKRIIRVVDEKEFDPATSEDNENEV